MQSVRNQMSLFACKNLSSAKKIHNSVVKNVEKTHEEIRISVPWGHIAGKWWGPRDRRPILVLHGWQDNCGSFDRLIPLLPNNLGFLTIDYPGHGLSSQLPNGIFYHGFDSTILLKRIQDYFAWEKISLLSHSMGGIMNFSYTSLFPKNVDMLVIIDPLVKFKTLPEQSIKVKVENIEKFLTYEKRNTKRTQSPTYTYEECINMQHSGSYGSINIENCKYILNRSIELSSGESNKYFFTRDPRIKVGTLIGMQNEDILQHAKHISCPFMVLQTITNSYSEYRPFFCSDVIELLKTNQRFEHHFVNGNHHVHLNEPEKVAKFINAFLAKHGYGHRNQGGIKNEIKFETQQKLLYSKI